MVCHLLAGSYQQLLTGLRSMTAPLFLVNISLIDAESLAQSMSLAAIFALGVCWDMNTMF